jgi:hypothetical protein
MTTGPQRRSPVPRRSNALFHLSQYRADQDRTHGNPDRGERAPQEQSFGRAPKASPEAWVQARAIRADRSHCLDASHLPLRGTPPEAAFHLPEPALPSIWPLA